MGEGEPGGISNTWFSFNHMSPAWLWLSADVLRSWKFGMSGWSASHLNMQTWPLPVAQVNPPNWGSLSDSPHRVEGPLLLYSTLYWPLSLIVFSWVYFLMCPLSLDRALRTEPPQQLEFWRQLHGRRNSVQSRQKGRVGRRQTEGERMQESTAFKCFSHLEIPADSRQMLLLKTTNFGI